MQRAINEGKPIMTYAVEDCKLHQVGNASGAREAVREKYTRCPLLAAHYSLLTCVRTTYRSLQPSWGISILSHS